MVYDIITIDKKPKKIRAYQCMPEYDGYLLLRSAIIKRALVDWLEAKMRVETYPHINQYKQKLDTINKQLNHTWFQFILGNLSLTYLKNTAQKIGLKNLEKTGLL